MYVHTNTCIYININLPYRIHTDIHIYSKTVTNSYQLDNYDNIFIYILNKWNTFGMGYLVIFRNRQQYANRYERLNFLNKIFISDYLLI